MMKMTKRDSIIRKARRINVITLGQCRHCKNDRLPRSQYCMKHLMYQRQLLRKQKLKRIEEGRCRNCGGEINEFAMLRNIQCCSECNSKKLR